MNRREGLLLRVSRETPTVTETTVGAISHKEENNLQTVREEMLLSKAELARRAGVSALTIDRIEDGLPCRLDTKRKIILALGLKLSEKERVFKARKL